MNKIFIFLSILIIATIIYIIWMLEEKNNNDTIKIKLYKDDGVHILNVKKTTDLSHLNNKKQ